MSSPGEGLVCPPLQMLFLFAHQGSSPCKYQVSSSYGELAIRQLDCMTIKVLVEGLGGSDHTGGKNRYLMCNNFFVN